MLSRGESFDVKAVVDRLQFALYALVVVVRLAVYLEDSLCKIGTQVLDDLLIALARLGWLGFVSFLRGFVEDAAILVRCFGVEHGFDLKLRLSHIWFIGCSIDDLPHEIGFEHRRFLLCLPLHPYF